MSEQWLPLPFDNRYFVSSLGKVQGPRKLLKPLKKRGQLYLKVWISGKYHCIHHLVALTFLGDKPEGMLVLHKDGNALNNRASNLYYGTYSDNAKDRVKHGVFNYPKRELTAIDKHFIVLFFKAGYTRKRLTKMWNVSYSTIQRTIYQ